MGIQSVNGELFLATMVYILNLGIQNVLHAGSHTFGVLHMTKVLSVEAQLSTADRSILEKDRLHLWLDEIKHGAWTALDVIALAFVAGTPGTLRAISSPARLVVNSVSLI